jgi:hypothetical protein
MESIAGRHFKKTFVKFSPVHFFLFAIDLQFNKNTYLCIRHYSVIHHDHSQPHIRHCLQVYDER